MARGKGIKAGQPPQTREVGAFCPGIWGRRLDEEELSGGFWRRGWCEAKFGWVVRSRGSALTGAFADGRICDWRGFGPTTDINLRCCTYMARNRMVNTSMAVRVCSSSCIEEINSTVDSPLDNCQGGWKTTCDHMWCANWRRDFFASSIVPFAALSSSNLGREPAMNPMMLRNGPREISTVQNLQGSFAASVHEWKLPRQSCRGECLPQSRR